MHPTSAKRFLFLQYETALGTAVNSTPVFTALRKSRPDALIAVACSGIPFELLKENPSIDVIYQTPHPLQGFLATFKYFVRHRREFSLGYDYVVLDSGNNRFLYSLLAWLSGVRRRVGFVHSKNLLHEAMTYDRSLSIIANNLRLVQHFTDLPQLEEPKMFFSKSDLEWVRTFLHEHNINPNRPILAFQTQTSGGQPNQRYEDRFAAVSDAAMEQREAQSIFIGSKAEAARVNSLLGRLRHRGISAVGETNLSRLAALLSQCDLLVTLDTGTMHVGRTVGVPMVVIAPASNPTFQWLPRDDLRYLILIRDQIECARCQRNFCSHRSCMDQIAVSEVVEAIKKQLNDFPPSPKMRKSRASQRLVDCNSNPTVIFAQAVTRDGDAS